MLRKVGAENIVLSTDGSFNGMIKLNHTAADLWDFFQTEHTKEEGIEYLSSRYEAEPATLEKGVSDFMALIEQNGFNG